MRLTPHVPILRLMTLVFELYCWLRRAPPVHATSILHWPSWQALRPQRAQLLPCLNAYPLSSLRRDKMIRRDRTPQTTPSAGAQRQGAGWVRKETFHRTRVFSPAQPSALYRRPLILPDPHRCACRRADRDETGSAPETRP